ncbi:MAG: midcut-by-XrtH protein [Comamonas sp.]
MLTQFSSLMRTGVAAVAVLATSMVQAGVAVPAGAIDYGPQATGVPALGEWSLMLLALLLVAIAYRVLRGRVGGRMLANLLLVGSAAAAGMAGYGMVQRADADGSADLNLRGGGTIDLFEGETKVTNTSDVSQQIRARRANALPVLTLVPAPAHEKALATYVFVPPVGAPECTAGSTLASNASCYVKLLPPSPVD